MSEDRPFVQIPVPSSEDVAVYEEWLKKHKQQEEDQEEKERVVILQL